MENVAAHRGIPQSLPLKRDKNTVTHPRQPVTPCQTDFALTQTKQTLDPPPARHTKRPPAALKIRTRHGAKKGRFAAPVDDESYAIPV
jgi:hypothetical protein